jgi:hypothetical protein
MREMTSFSGRFLIALCVWETCVIGFVLASIALTRGHFWGKNDLVWIAALAACGLFVIAVVALLSRRFGKIGGAIMGLVCGLFPSVFILTWVLVARPGFEASAGGAGVAYMLAIPSGVGGVLAGVICSGQKKYHQPS